MIYRRNSYLKYIQKIFRHLWYLIRWDGRVCLKLSLEGAKTCAKNLILILRKSIIMTLKWYLIHGLFWCLGYAMDQSAKRGKFRRDLIRAEIRANLRNVGAETGKYGTEVEKLGKKCFAQLPTTSHIIITLDHFQYLPIRGRNWNWAAVRKVVLRPKFKEQISFNW